MNTYKVSKRMVWVVVLGALAVATAAAAQGRGPGRRGGNGFVMRMLAQLDLTPEQRTQVKAAHDELAAKNRALRDKLRTLHEQMRAQWQEDTPDEEAILELHEQIHELKGEMARNRIAFRLKVHALLTPEQREKAAQLRDQRRGRRGRGMGPGPGCPGPVPPDAPWMQD